MVILVNNELVKIGRNLFDFLCRLQLPDEDRTIWVDALCINQNDISERNHQVRLMGDIYRCAEAVLVWLGSAADDSDRVFAVHLWRSEDLAELAQLKTCCTEDPARLNNRHTPKTEYPKDRDGEINWIENWKVMSRLCRREYWSRLWIIQELILAKEIYLLCGNSWACWAYFQKEFRIISTQATRQRRNVATRETRRTRSEFQDLKGLVPGRLALHREYYEAYSLEELLDMYSDSASRDVHDKVFGLIGIANDCHDGRGDDLIDYSGSVEDLFFKVMDFCRPRKPARFGRQLARTLSLGHRDPLGPDGSQAQMALAVQVIGRVTIVIDSPDERSMIKQDQKSRNPPVNNAHAPDHTRQKSDSPRVGYYVARPEDTDLLYLLHRTKYEFIFVQSATANLDGSFTSRKVLFRWERLKKWAVDIQVSKTMMWDLLQSFHGYEIPETLFHDSSSESTLGDTAIG